MATEDKPTVLEPRKKTRKPPVVRTCEVCHRVIEKGEPTITRPIWSSGKRGYYAAMSYEDAKALLRHARARSRRFFHEACFDREWRYGSDSDEGDDEV